MKNKLKVLFTQNIFYDFSDNSKNRNIFVIIIQKNADYEFK